MAIARVSGKALADNLERTSNLAVDTSTLFIDVTNNRVGIGTATPTQPLHAPGTAKVANLTLAGNALTSESTLNLSGSPVNLGANTAVTITGGTTGQILSTNGSGALSWIDAGGGFGNVIELGTPTDGNISGPDVAYDGWTTSTMVTDGIDDLNQVALNIANNKYVGQASFVGTPTSGPSPTTVSFTGTFIGNANGFEWNFGDGNTSTQQNPAHTYNNASGGQFTVSFTAKNTNGTHAGNIAAGARGSADSFTRTNYITLFTPTPIPAFTLADSTIDSGTVATITNTSQFVTTSFDLSWGQGANVQPATDFTTVSNTYNNTGGDTQYNIVLTGVSNTAGASPVSVTTAPTTISVFTPQTTTFSANVVRVVNEEATSGGVVQFTNTTATDPGTTALFGSGQKYRYTFGDGNVSSINIQNGVAGNPGSTLNHTYALSGGQQSGGTTATFQTQLSTLTGHSSSPFNAANIAIVVEPDIRSIFSGTLVTVSDRTGDDAQDGYLFTDYRSGVETDRGLVTFQNTSQNVTTTNFTFGDGNTTGAITSGAGTPGAANITNSYGSVASFTVALVSSGTPDTIAQTDTETKTNFITIKANPAAPGALSSKTLSMSTGSQGTAPLLAAGATDRSGGNIPANGSSVTRYTSADPIQTSTVTDANTAISGSLTATFNNSASGAVTFTAGGDGAGTYTDLVVVNDGDAHNEISASTYPTGFAKVFDARVSKATSGINVGYNDTSLTHSTAGTTNTVGFVKDDMTSVPTVGQGSATIAEATAGTYRYISGVPYYNTGSPAVNITGLTVTNFVGQTYRNTTAPFTSTTGTLAESTSGSLISSQNKTYAEIDGSPTFLTGGIPNATTGVGSAYTLGTINILINGSARAVGYIDAQMINVNGSSSVVNLTNKYIQVYSASLTGFDEENIPVSDSLGTNFDDDGKRVTGFGSFADTPSFAGGTNYYTANAFTGAATVTGTSEAIVRFGTLKHFVTNLSSGYLPVGSDLATNRSGNQYITFAFRRATVANFDIAINSTTGIKGVFIGAPGTAIEMLVD
jgi:PKD repeat protein